MGLGLRREEVGIWREGSEGKKMKWWDAIGLRERGGG